MAENPVMAVQRRTVLAAAAASGLLVACGSGSEESSGDAASSGSTSSTPPTGSSAPAGGEALALAADVPVEGGIIDRDAHIVVTQPTAGEYRAFTSICTHQGCDVSGVAANTITCGCHGSKFSAETGDVEHGPATKALAEVAVKVEGDAIVRA